jgi:hypothetical protein
MSSRADAPSASGSYTHQCDVSTSPSDLSSQSSPVQESAAASGRAAASALPAAHLQQDLVPASGSSVQPEKILIWYYQTCFTYIYRRTKKSFWGSERYTLEACNARLV